MEISRWYSFSVTKSLYCAFQLNCYTVWQQEGVRDRWTKKKERISFRQFVIETNFFFNSLQEAQRWSLPGHKSVNRLDNIWAYLTPALSWLLQVPDDAIIWPWDIVIVRESIFSVGLLLSPSPVLAAQDYCARTVYRFLQWIVFSWFLTFHSSH